MAQGQFWSNFNRKRCVDHFDILTARLFNFSLFHYAHEELNLKASSSPNIWLESPIDHRKIGPQIRTTSPRIVPLPMRTHMAI